MKFIGFLITLSFILFSNISSAENFFKVYIPKAKEPIVANISDSNYVTFISYPTLFNGSLSIESASIGLFYPNKMTCKQVEMRAKNAVNAIFPESIRNGQKSMVRHYSTVNINLDSGINFQMSTFNRKVKEAAAKIKNTDISHIQYDNSFTIDKIDYDIEYSSDAISNIIDNKTEFRNQTNQFLGQPMFANGVISSNNTFTDLVCDLYLGRAKLKMNFYGKFGEQESTYQILEPEEIFSVYRDIMNHNEDYFDISTVNAKNRNIVLSTLFLREALINLRQDKISNNILISLFERIISSETGRVIPNLKNEELNKLMEVKRIAPNTYKAVVVYEYTQ